MKRVLPYLPPLLLCLVAIFQVYLARTQDLSPWKGGGFGMFSSNDHDARRIEIWVAEPEGERKIEVPYDLRLARIAGYPSEKRLSALARSTIDRENRRGASVTRARVAAWRQDFDPRTLEPRDVLIREVIVDTRELSPR